MWWTCVHEGRLEYFQVCFLPNTSLLLSFSHEYCLIFFPTSLSNAPFQIQYADQSGATGTIGEDSVTVAGLTIDKQAFGAVDNEFGGFSRPGNNAALLGLGFPGNAVSQQTPFFNNLAEQGKLASNLFSFFMTRSDAQGSELCLGCMDTSKFTGGEYRIPVSVNAGI